MIVTGTVVLEGFTQVLAEGGFTFTGGKKRYIIAPSGHYTGFCLVDDDCIMGNSLLETSPRDERAHGFNELVHFVTSLEPEEGSSMATGTENTFPNVYVFRDGRWWYTLHATFSMPIGDADDDRLRRQLDDMGAWRVVGGEAIK